MSVMGQFDAEGPGDLQLVLAMRTLSCWDAASAPLPSAIAFLVVVTRPGPFSLAIWHPCVVPRGPDRPEFPSRGVDTPVDRPATTWSGRTSDRGQRWWDPGSGDDPGASRR